MKGSLRYAGCLRAMNDICFRILSLYKKNINI